MNDYSINIQIFSNIADSDGWGMLDCGLQREGCFYIAVTFRYRTKIL